MIDILKEKLKKIVLPLFLSIVAGCFCGSIVYNIYTNDNEIAFSSNIIYLLQTGVYSDYDNMRANAVANNYVYYEDDGVYKTIIGITQDKDNVERIKKIFGGEIVVNSYSINDIDMFNKIKDFDLKIKREEDDREVHKMVLSMLKVYKDKKNIQLTRLD